MGYVNGYGEPYSLSTIGSSTGTSVYDYWGSPRFIKAQEVGESIEFIYIQTSTISYSIYPQRSPDRRVFKIVYSCKDGKWNKSESIYGKIIPEQKERYEFD